MNNALLAIIGILILIIALLVLKKISSTKREKPQQEEIESEPALSADEEAIVSRPDDQAAEVDSTFPSSEEAKAVPKVEIEPPATPHEETPLRDAAEKDAGTVDLIEEELVTQDEELFRPAEEEVAFELQPEPDIPPETSPEEAAAVLEEVEPEDITEEEPEPLVETPAAAIDFSIELFADRLRRKEEVQRQAVTEAVNKGEEKTRDALQLELVAINEKLALLEDSYQKECDTYQRVLELINHLRTNLDSGAADAAISDLVNGKSEKAEQLLSVFGEQPGDDQALAVFYSARLAECRFDLATAFERYKQAISVDPENPAYLHTAGLTAKQMYKYPQAIEWLNNYIQISKTDNGTDPVALAEVKRDLAYTYVVAGQSQKAGPLYKEAMTAFTEILGQDHAEMATCWYQIGELQETMGEYDKAVSLYKKALTILDKAKGSEHPALAPVLAKLAALCMELELEKEAVPLFERLVAIREATLPATHPQLSMSLNSLAESYRLQGQYQEAEKCYLKTLEIAEATQGKNSAAVGAILQELAKLCQNQKKKEEADQYQSRASAIFAKVVEEQEKQSQDNSLSLEL